MKRTGAPMDGSEVPGLEPTPSGKWLKKAPITSDTAPFIDGKMPLETPPGYPVTVFQKEKAFRAFEVNPHDAFEADTKAKKAKQQFLCENPNAPSGEELRDGNGKVLPNQELRKYRLGLIVEGLRQGKLQKTIAEETGISQQEISRIYIPLVPAYLMGKEVKFGKKKPAGEERLEIIKKKHADILDNMTSEKMAEANLAQLASAAKALVDQEKLLDNKSASGVSNYLKSWERMTTKNGVTTTEKITVAGDVEIPEDDTLQNEGEPE